MVELQVKNSISSCLGQQDPTFPHKQQDGTIRLLQMRKNLPSEKLQVFHTVHLSSIILRITNRCHFLDVTFFVIFLYYMSLPYMFRASINPSSGVFPAVAICCHLVHVVLGVCPRASGSFDVTKHARGHTPSTT